MGYDGLILYGEMNIIFTLRSDNPPSSDRLPVDLSRPSTLPPHPFKLCCCLCSWDVDVVRISSPRIVRPLAVNWKFGNA